LAGHKKKIFSADLRLVGVIFGRSIGYGVLSMCVTVVPFYI